MTIALWIRRGGVDIANAVLLAEAFEEVGIELRSVVGDKGSGDSKSFDHVLPHKVPRVLFGDRGQRFGLNPLGEIIGGYY